MQLQIQMKLSNILCSKCKLHIMDSTYIVILDNTVFLHQSCFECYHCKKNLTNQGFYNNNNEVYCHECFNLLYCSVCAKCKKHVESGELVKALHLCWHLDCFICESCKKPIKSLFTVDKNNFLCKECHIHLIEKCAKCSKVITGTEVVAAGKKWHELCFECSECLKPIYEDEFAYWNEKFYHKICLGSHQKKKNSFNQNSLLRQKA